MEYWLDRNALRVRWAGSCQIIPLHSIQRIIEGVDEISLRPSLLAWPAPFVRVMEGRQGRRLVRMASVPLDQCLLIETDGGIFAISPADPVGFLEELQALNRLGLSRRLPLQREQPTNYYALATESLVGRWLLLAGLIGCLALLGYLMIRFPQLPDTLVFHYNRQDVPDSIRPKSALFLLPVIGLLTYLTKHSGRPVDEAAGPTFGRLFVLDRIAARAGALVYGPVQPDEYEWVAVMRRLPAEKPFTSRWPRSYSCRAPI